MMRTFCTYCGAANPPDARFCLDCRKLIAPAASSPATQPPVPATDWSSFAAADGAPLPVDYYMAGLATPPATGTAPPPYAPPLYAQLPGYAPGVPAPGPGYTPAPLPGYGAPAAPLPSGYGVPSGPLSPGYPQAGLGQQQSYPPLPYVPYGAPPLTAGLPPGHGLGPAYGQPYLPQVSYGGGMVPAGPGSPAEFWPRLGALLVDYCVLGSLWFCLVGLSVLLELPALGMLATFLGPALYFVGFWATSGRTPGYRAAGLQLVRSDYTKADLGNSIVRYIGTVISWSFFCLGYLWMLWDPERQTWHDKMASTRVIKT